MFLGILLSVVPPEKLTAIEGMNATFEALLGYMTRHQARADSLLQKTFVFDLVLQSSGMGLTLMDEFNGTSAPSGVALLGKVGEGGAKQGSAGFLEAREACKRQAEDALKATLDVLHRGTGAVPDGSDRPEADGEGEEEEEGEDSSEDEQEGAMEAMAEEGGDGDDDDEDDDESGDSQDGEAVKQRKRAPRGRTAAVVDVVPGAPGAPTGQRKRARTSA